MWVVLLRVCDFLLFSHVLIVNNPPPAPERGKSSLPSLSHLSLTHLSPLARACTYTQTEILLKNSSQGQHILETVTPLPFSLFPHTPLTPLTPPILSSSTHPTPTPTLPPPPLHLSQPSSPFSVYSLHQSIQLKSQPSHLFRFLPPPPCSPPLPLGHGPGAA